ncbi:MAG TPA: M48 family peptidase [Sedimenticola thiotaurini]|uniref:M48 family peptidase n=1 Tax=Sedimenticola thiotaurini TaxID=1543721 RepID=A0A831W9U6_9GAMM|nr:M48 family peptidase [Sedimenticola thiotaurini]
MHPFTLIVLLALFAGLLLELWLLQRQQRHVAAHRDRVPERFRDRVSLEQHRKAADYTLAKVRLARWQSLYGGALFLLFTLGGIIEWLDLLWRQVALPPIPQGIGLILSALLLLGAAELPLTLWRTFVLEQRFGFNRTTAGRFVKDLLLQLLLLALLGIPLLWAMLWLMQRAGSYWWLYAWLLWTGFTLFVSWAYPSFIAPLFNRFTPLPEGELRQRILGLLQRCGFDSGGIFVMDGSRRSAHGNAYFTGLGRRKRIVFYDTLMEKLEPDELEGVLAHELGHFSHHHVRKQLLLSAAMSLAGLAILGWLAQQPWFYHGLGVGRPSNAAALLLFLLIVPLFSQFLSPLLAMLSRRHEFEADAFASRQTGAEPLISALVKLYRDNASTLTPDPLYSGFHDSHPPAPVRIARLETLSHAAAR